MTVLASQLFNEAIWPRLVLGEPPVVGACRVEGAFVVQWGVEGALLSCDPEGARTVADALEAGGWLPTLVDLLRMAADICDAKNRAGVALQ
jgi:hypothetical protein